MPRPAPIRLFAALLASLLAAGAHALPPDHAAEKYKTNPPPSAELNYSVQAQQSGFSLAGETFVKWHVGEGRFELSTETKSKLFGKVASAASEGALDAFGLAPENFQEKRFRREATSALFDRDRKLISFKSSDQVYPIKGGEQDRNTAVWQLASVARAAQEKFKPGSAWKFFVVGPRDADPWVFKVEDTDMLDTPLGSLKTIRVLKSTQADEKSQQVEVWLAPSLEWYPVRLRYTEPDGDFIEQTLTSVSRKPH